MAFFYENELRDGASVASRAVSSNLLLRQDPSGPTVDQQMDHLTEVREEGEIAENSHVDVQEEEQDFELTHRQRHQYLSGDLVSPAEPVISNNIADPTCNVRDESNEIHFDCKKGRGVNYDVVTETYPTLNLEMTNSISHTSVSHGIDTAQSSPLMPARRRRSPDITHVHPSLRSMHSTPTFPSVFQLIFISPVTTQDFPEAKLIILDLLGWGVPSEYLLGCGLTRESIYYAFTELNLRRV
ncbi:hypothetical protein BU17DRAFT_81792 [Hysterangium stoloniferum]|nr:hypothetical protein BU17DRAFT_81792 [Hysterangium stoloniferum]